MLRNKFELKKWFNWKIILEILSKVLESIGPNLLPSIRSLIVKFMFSMICFLLSRLSAKLKNRNICICTYVGAAMLSNSQIHLILKTEYTFVELPKAFTYLFVAHKTWTSHLIWFNLWYHQNLKNNRLVVNC